LTRKYRCGSPTCNRSPTSAPLLLLLLHHAYGPSCESQVYLIIFPHSRICFIITISTAISLSFNHFFIFYVFLITPINIVVLCPTIVIIPFFIFELLLFKSQTVTVQLLLSRRWTIIVQLLLSWTVIVLNHYCLDIELLLSNHYCLELLLYWIVTV
jgi:hypothetical protein